MRNGKEKTGFWIDAALLSEIDSMLEKSQSGNRTEFVVKAIKFYIGFLRTEKTESYLLSTFTAAIQGTVNGAEGRIVGMLYKLAVELAMLNRIIAYDRNFAESALEQIRIVSVNDINKTMPMVR